MHTRILTPIAWGRRAIRQIHEDRRSEDTGPDNACRELSTVGGRVQALKPQARLMTLRSPSRRQDVPSRKSTEGNKRAPAGDG